MVDNSRKHFYHQRILIEKIFIVNEVLGVAFCLYYVSCLQAIAPLPTYHPGFPVWVLKFMCCQNKLSFNTVGPLLFAGNEHYCILCVEGIIHLLSSNF